MSSWQSPCLIFLSTGIASWNHHGQLLALRCLFTNNLKRIKGASISFWEIKVNELVSWNHLGFSSKRFLENIAWNFQSVLCFICNWFPKISSFCHGLGMKCLPDGSGVKAPQWWTLAYQWISTLVNDAKMCCSYWKVGRYLKSGPSWKVMRVGP